jgi:aminoglycoside phosphotransferase family enzyme
MLHSVNSADEGSASVEDQLIARLKEVLNNFKDISLDYIVEQVRDLLKKRTIKAFHVNKHIPSGYEDQGAFNVLIVTRGHTLFDCVVGEEYFRYDAVAITAIDKFQVIDGMWENKETSKSEAFLSLRLSHGDESHIALALEDNERASVKAVSELVLSIRNPE